MTENSDKYHLVADATGLGHTMPKELAQTEAKIDDAMPSPKARARMEAQRDKLLKKRAPLQNRKDLDEDQQAERTDLTAQIEDLKGKIEPNLDSERGEYQSILGDVVKRETMKDLVRIAQTGVGRDLLDEVSTNRGGPQVGIHSYSEKFNPDAGRAKSGAEDYVNYTPQAFKDRDARPHVRGEAKDMRAAKKTNPWQLNNRTDVTLFHELTHAMHFQTGALDPLGANANELVDDKTAVHDVDKPFDGPQGPAGVRKEEYRTVGLGEFKDDPITENAYRKARQDLGEKDVALRDAYVHKDADGKRMMSKELLGGGGDVDGAESSLDDGHSKIIVD
jgi:hypothetical protein